MWHNDYRTFCGTRTILFQDSLNMFLNSKIGLHVKDCLPYLIFINTDVQDNTAPQPVAIATASKTETVDDSNKEQIQLEDIIEKKSNKEEQTLQDVAKDTVKINTNNYINEHDKVQKSHADVKEGIGDDENFDQDEETKDIEETTKMQLAEQKVQKRSLTPAFVQGDTDQISQKELLHIVASEVLHYDKHISIPETEPDRKSTIVQVRPNWCK